MFHTMKVIIFQSQVPWLTYALFGKVYDSYCDWRASGFWYCFRKCSKRFLRIYICINRGVSEMNRYHWKINEHLFLLLVFGVINFGIEIFSVLLFLVRLLFSSRRSGAWTERIVKTSFIRQIKVYIHDFLTNIRYKMLWNFNINTHKELNFQLFAADKITQKKNDRTSRRLRTMQIRPAEHLE